MDVAVTPRFRRLFKKLPVELQEEVLEKIELFTDPGSHTALRVHKLQGRLADQWSFSVNYRYRIVFVWEERNISAILIAVGDHDLYT